MVSAIERGRHLPGVEVMVALARALHADPMEVIERVELATVVPVDLTGVSPQDLEQRARASFWAGDFRAALAAYDAMIEQLLLDPPKEESERRSALARIEVCRATSLRRCGALSAARASAERAVTLAEGAPELQAEAYVLLAELLAWMDRLPLARDAADRAVVLSIGRAVKLQGWAWMVKGQVLFQSDRIEEARCAFVEAREKASTAGDHVHLSHIEGDIGMCLLAQGRIKEARESIIRAIELAREHDTPALEASWLVELGNIALDQGLLDEADRHAVAALQIAKPKEHLLTVFRGEWLRHHVLLRRDRTAADRHRLAYLRKLFGRLEDHRGVREIREFKAAVMGSPPVPEGRPS